MVLIAAILQDVLWVAAGAVVAARPLQVVAVVPVANWHRASLAALLTPIAANFQHQPGTAAASQHQPGTERAR